MTFQYANTAQQAKTCIQERQEGGVSKHALTNRKSYEDLPQAELTGAKESAANLAGFNGAEDVVEGVYICGEYIAAFPILAMHWGALI